MDDTGELNNTYDVMHNIVYFKNMVRQNRSI
jgi:hypothetical protein